MATKWYQNGSTAPVKEERCPPCKAGQHAERGCYGPLGCTCHCTRPGVPVIPDPTPFPLRASTENALSVLRAEGLQCRATRSRELVWKPKPATLSPPIRTILRDYQLELVIVLFPADDWRGQLAPYWFVGDDGTCIDNNCNVIGPGVLPRCNIYDPLGQCRHKSCGWVSGPPPLPAPNMHDVRIAH